MIEYPNRPQFFANKFCRLLTKSAAAMAIGADVCWMLTVIAHQEDVTRYSKPILYWNDQLMGLSGFGSRKRLIAARNRAISAGWLHYEKGGNRKAGLYWVEVPDGLSIDDDAPCSETSDYQESEEFNVTKLNSKSVVQSYETQLEPEFRATKRNSNQSSELRNGAPSGAPSGAPFNPIPKPKPKEKKSGKPSSSSLKKFDPMLVEFPGALDTKDFRREWSDWIEHRKEIKDPLTKTSVGRQLKQLEGWGIRRAIAAINHTIGKGWKGIREPDMPNGAPPSKSMYKSLDPSNGGGIA